jgi:ribose transport system ATP-binding protein
VAPLLQIRGVWKQFPGVLALRNIDLDVAEGEIVALVGENGAGKSTLMRILAGIHPPDRGEILWRGEKVLLRTPRDSAALGIVLIHQELNLADNLDIAGNLYLGREPHWHGLMRKNILAQHAEPWLRAVGLPLPAKTPVKNLSIAQRQLVEIAKALSRQAKLLILDEPTSSLTQREADKLFQVMEDLRNQGVAMIYISHRLPEIERMASRVIVLRDGECVGHLARDEIQREKMQTMMVGRPLPPRVLTKAEHTAQEKPALRVTDLQTKEFVQAKSSLEVFPGEIVGLAGLMGSGRTELLEAIFGIRAAQGGQIQVLGKDVTDCSLSMRIASGLSLVPEDRKEHGLVLNSPVRHNLTLAALRSVSLGGWVLRTREAPLSQQKVQELGIRCRSDMTMSQLLSGGNQQKVVLGKWLARKPKVLLLDEPTRGIDVGAKHELYALLEQLARSGLAVLFASSEMEELLRLSTRLYVMHDGGIVGALETAAASEQAIIRLATGGEG